MPVDCADAAQGVEQPTVTLGRWGAMSDTTEEYKRHHAHFGPVTRVSCQKLSAELPHLGSSLAVFRTTLRGVLATDCGVVRAGVAGVGRPRLRRYRQRSQMMRLAEAPPKSSCFDKFQGRRRRSAYPVPASRTSVTRRLSLPGRSSVPLFLTETANTILIVRARLGSSILSFRFIPAFDHPPVATDGFFSPAVFDSFLCGCCCP